MIYREIKIKTQFIDSTDIRLIRDDKLTYTDSVRLARDDYIYTEYVA
jgi:hypothetical protein